MSQAPGGYQSVFGGETTGSGTEAAATWEAALEVGAVASETINDLLGMLYIPTPWEVFSDPTGDPAPTPPPVVPQIPILGTGMPAPTALPPLVLGSVAGGTVSPAVEPAVIPVETTDEATDWGDIANRPAQCDPADLVCIAEFEGLPEGFGVAQGDDDVAIDWGDVIGVGLGSVAQQLVDTAVDRDNRIERTGVLIRIQLKQDTGFGSIRHGPVQKFRNG